MRRAGTQKEVGRGRSAGTGGHLGAVQAVAQGGHAREDLLGSLAKGLDDGVAQLVQQEALQPQCQTGQHGLRVEGLAAWADHSAY